MIASVKGWTGISPGNWLLSHFCKFCVLHSQIQRDCSRVLEFNIVPVARSSNQRSVSFCMIAGSRDEQWLLYTWWSDALCRHAVLPDHCGVSVGFGLRG